MIYRLVFLYFSVVAAELEMVQVLVRHGDRAPSFTYPADTNFDVAHHFPRGFSQLTPRGFQQAQELGGFLKNRYSGLIDRFDRREILIRSSDKDRCIETAMGITKTLFPEDIVPIHTYSHYKEDLLLKPNSVPCPRADQLIADDKRKLSELINSEHSELFHMLSEKTGWKVEGAKISDVYNVLYRKWANHVAQEAWVDGVMANVTELKRRFRMEQFNSAEKSKLRTGYLLGQVVKDFEAKMEGAREAKKFLIYASHDATVTSMMYSLGVSDHQLVPYTGALIMELHRIKEKRFVKILYRNSTLSPPVTIRLPGCSQLCPIDNFHRHVATRTVASKKEHAELCSLIAPSPQSIEMVEKSIDIPPNTILDNFKSTLLFGSLGLDLISTKLKQ